MTFRWLWDLCDASYSLVESGLDVERTERLVRLGHLLEQDIDVGSNGVSAPLWTAFVSLGQEIHDQDAVNMRLCSAFYEVGIVVRAMMQTYCEEQGIDYRELITGPRGDVNFKHKNLAHKD